MSYFIHAVTNGFLAAFDAELTYPPDRWYVGLYNIAPDRDGVGGAEVDVGSIQEYARQPVTWGTPANSVMTNTNTVRFPTPVTAGGYGEIVAMGLFLSDDPVAHPTPRAVLTPPGGSFTMPPGYDRELAAGFITLEFKE